jgi:uncharacterized protein
LLTTPKWNLIEREGGPLVARLPRTPGRLDSEYAHLFSGAVESVPADEGAQTTTRPEAGRSDRLSQLEARIDAIEQELVQLKQLLAE